MTIAVRLRQEGRQEGIDKKAVDVAKNLLGLAVEFVIVNLN